VNFPNLRKNTKSRGLNGIAAKAIPRSRAGPARRWSLVRQLATTTRVSSGVWS
jgi:hypothetical protein